MPHRPVEAALHQRALPARHRLFQHALRIFTQPVTHIGQLIQRAVGHRLHAFAQAAAAAMHAGRHLRAPAGEVVLGVQHFACGVGAQAAAQQLFASARQPQRSVHHVQVIIQQGKTQIVRADAVRPMFIHANGGG